jgi:hypothetical protein
MQLSRNRYGQASGPLSQSLRAKSRPPSSLRAAGKRAAAEQARLERELDALHRRMDTAYDDKLNSTISDEFWQRKQADWEAEDARLKELISALREGTVDDRLRRILKLAQNVYSLYLTRNQQNKPNC